MPKSVFVFSLVVLVGAEGWGTPKVIPIPSYAVCVTEINKAYDSKTSPFFRYSQVDFNDYSPEVIITSSATTYTLYTANGSYSLKKDESDCLSTSHTKISEVMQSGLDQIVKAWPHLTQHEKNGIRAALNTKYCRTLPEVRSDAVLFSLYPEQNPKADPNTESGIVPLPASDSKNPVSP